MDIASFDLDGNVDAVEFCSYPTLHQLLAPATYTLQQDEDQPIRSRSISLFSAISRFKLLDHLQTPTSLTSSGIPASVNSIAHHPLLAQATSDGFLSLYSLHPIEFSLSEVCREEVSSSMCLCVDGAPMEARFQ